MTIELTCFKAYDIRGELGEEMNEDIAYRIGRAYGEYLRPKNVVIGGDVRHSSEPLKKSVANGLMDAGVNVHDLGLTGTEEIYFATSYLQFDGGIEITASHNPLNFNGMKLVREKSIPISGDSGLTEIKNLAEANSFSSPAKRGRLNFTTVLPAYIDHLLTYVDSNSLIPMRLVVNPGNGSAGVIIDALEEVFIKRKVPVEFIKINHVPDGNFPNGIPNPLLPENRVDTSSAVIKYKADMGIAWDGDFDRCFLFDETGRYIEGYYIVGLLAEAFLRKKPENDKFSIVHDPRLTWNTISIIEKNGGTPILCKTGHAYIKERMRAEDAVYGGEMSGHHYFRDFAYCDSGMIPWLLVSGLLSVDRVPLSVMVDKGIDAYPSSGEINFIVKDTTSTINRVLEKYHAHALQIDDTDGYSFEFEDWRFNIRSSNTEPLLRLNVESRGNIGLMKEMTNNICELINMAK